MKLIVNRTLMAAILFSFSGLCGSTDSETMRDPFWPVGYVPVAQRQKPVEAKPVKPPPPAPVRKVVAEAPKPVVDWEAARKSLQFSGFAEANGVRSFFVNGRLVSEGETISRDYLGLRYTWRVVRIAREPADRRLEDLTVRPTDH